MPLVQPISAVICNGTLSSDAVTHSPVCTGTPGTWSTVSTLAIDPAASATLTTVLETGGVDWSIVEWVFGSGLVLFAVGAGIGAVLNVVRKARHI